MMRICRRHQAIQNLLQLTEQRDPGRAFRNGLIVEAAGKSLHCCRQRAINLCDVQIYEPGRRVSLFRHSFAQRLHDRPVFGEEGLPDGSCASHQVWVGWLPGGFIGTSGLKVNTGCRTIDFHFSLGAAAYRADGRLFGRTEPFGGTLCAERAARHRAWSIPPGSLTLLLAVRIIERLYWGDGGCIGVAEVRIPDGESIENALRRFKRKVQQEDIIKEVKKHSFYLKPGEKKRIKQALARKRSRKKVRRVPEE